MRRFSSGHERSTSALGIATGTLRAGRSPGAASLLSVRSRLAGESGDQPALPLPGYPPRVRLEPLGVGLRPGGAFAAPAQLPEPAFFAPFVLRDRGDVGDEFLEFAVREHVSEGRHARFALGDRVADVRLFEAASAGGVEVVAPASRAGVGERVAAGAYFVEARAGVGPAVLSDALDLHD